MAATDLDVSTIKETLRRLEPMLIQSGERMARIEEWLARIEATLPHLATRAELAEKPGKAWLTGAIAVLITTYAAGLAALAVLLPVLRSIGGHG